MSERIQKQQSGEMVKSIKADTARAYFDKGFNCAQAVVAAFAKEMGLNESDALKISSSFGGGMGGMREVCGAVSGMAMVMGMLTGYDSPADKDAKQQLYQRIQKLAAEMTDRYHTIICRDLLAQKGITPAPAPAERDAAYYQMRPCARYVETCAALLEEALSGEKA